MAGRGAYRPRHAAPTYSQLMLILRRALPRTHLADTGPPPLQHRRDGGDQRRDAEAARLPGQE